MLRHDVAIAQGIYFGLTGPKIDLWLVRCVAALITVTAAALGLHETYYALCGVISRIYLADAVVEAALIAGWLLAR